MSNLYYPNSHPSRLNEDLRILYDHMYATQAQATPAKVEGVRHGPTAPESNPGGPSTTKIAGLNVKGILPTSGNQVATLSKIPTLGYNVATGEIEWFILP